MIYSQKQIEQEDEADDELVLIGLEVTEDGGPVHSSQFDQSMNFPEPRTSMASGTKRLVLMPDSGLNRLYSDDRFVVHHDPSEMAKCLLSGAYLPPRVFGRGAEPDVQQRVFDFFDLDNHGLDAEDEYRKDLAEIAGDDPEAIEMQEQTRVEELTEKYTYGELKSKASDLGIENPHQSKDDLAEYVSEHEE